MFPQLSFSRTYGSINYDTPITRTSIIKAENNPNLPIVFFCQKNGWTDIAFNILRSVHSENSFQKKGMFTFKNRKKQSIVVEQKFDYERGSSFIPENLSKIKFFKSNLFNFS